MTLYGNIAESLWQSCLNEDIGSAELYINRLNEKALFGSMASSIEKWKKQINKLKVEIAVFDRKPSTPKDVQATIDNWKKSAEDLLRKMNSPDFVAAMKAVDDNTGWFGGDKGKLGKKGSGFTSTRINKDYGLVEEAVDPTSKITNTIITFAQSAQNFTNQTKALADAGMKMPGTNFKKFLKSAGPVLSLGGLALGLAATAMSGGAAAPVLAGIAGGMKTVGLGLTSGRSFAGAGRAFARGENGKGALKTGLGALSAAGAYMSAANTAGNVANLKAAHAMANPTPEQIAYQNGEVVDNWQKIGMEQSDTMGLQPGSVQGNVDISQPEVVQQIETPSSSPVFTDDAGAASFEAAKAEVVPEVQEAMPQADPAVQDQVADYVAKYDGEVTTTPTGEVEITYEDGTAEIIKETPSGDYIAVDANTGNPVEQVTPAEVPPAQQDIAEEVVTQNVPETTPAEAAANTASNATGMSAKMSQWCDRAAQVAEVKHYDTVTLNFQQLGECDVYGFPDGTITYHPVGSNTLLTGLQHGYGMTPDGKIVQMTTKMTQDSMWSELSSGKKLYYTALDIGYSVTKL